MKTLSKYRECQNCKDRFKLPKSTLKLEQRYLNDGKQLTIFCTMCQSTNISLIEKVLYEKK